MQEPFTIEIAGLVTRVSPLFQSTREYCKTYLTNKDAEFSICVSEEDLIYQQILLDREAIEEGLKVRKFKDPFLERATIQRKVADQLLHQDTLLLHGSTVAVDGQAYLFTAPCGTGKSTHTRLWRELFGERAVMVNDDKPFLKISSSGVLAFGSPWSGKHGLDSNVCVPLRGICFLRRGRDNLIHRLDSVCAIAELQHQAYFPTDAALLSKRISLVESLSKIVPLWAMSCNMEPEAAMVSYSAMRNAELGFARAERIDECCLRI